MELFDIHEQISFSRAQDGGQQKPGQQQQQPGQKPGQGGQQGGQQK